MRGKLLAAAGIASIAYSAWIALQDPTSSLRPLNNKYSITKQVIPPQESTIQRSPPYIHKRKGKKHFDEIQFRPIQLDLKRDYNTYDGIDYHFDEFIPECGDC